MRARYANGDETHEWVLKLKSDRLLVDRGGRWLGAKFTSIPRCRYRCAYNSSIEKTCVTSDETSN